MFSNIVKIDESKFPKSFWLLQQEAILANSCILTGLEFMHSFAAATGRYHKISNMTQVGNVAPLENWQIVIDRIKCEDFSESMHSRIETEVFNRLNPHLQMQDIVENTGYVNDVYRHILVSKTNYYAVLPILGPYFLVSPL